MNIEKLKKQWEEYTEDFTNSEYMDIDRHTSMAWEVGGLIQEIERLNGLVNQKGSNDVIQKKDEKIKELTSLSLWAARRMQKTYKEYMYDNVEEITGQRYERM